MSSEVGLVVMCRTVRGAGRSCLTPRPHLCSVPWPRFSPSLRRLHLAEGVPNFVEQLDSGLGEICGSVRRIGGRGRSDRSDQLGAGPDVVDLGGPDRCALGFGWLWSASRRPRRRTCIADRKWWSCTGTCGGDRHHGRHEGCVVPVATLRCASGAACRISCVECRRRAISPTVDSCRYWGGSLLARSSRSYSRSYSSAFSYTIFGHYY